MNNLFNYQTKNVNILTDKISKKIKGLKSGFDVKDQYFISPTGSGKTIMSFETIKSIEEDCLVVWIAPNKLDQQSFDKYDKFYSSNQDNRKGVKVNGNFTSSNIKDILTNPSKYLLMTNWASINKDDNVLLRDNETNTNLPYLFNQLKINNIPIIFFIDEAHIGTDDKTNSTKAKDFLNKYSDLNIKISATINETDDKDIVKVNWNEVVEEGVITKSIIFNENIEQLNINGIIKNSIYKLKDIEKIYKDNKINVNPLLLIQLENSEKGVDNREEIFNICLDNGIKENEIGIYLSDENTIPEDISKNDNELKVVISKVAIATGWDCPRAKVLCGLRNIGSDKLPVQTLGRITRMPELKHYENEILNTSYVYTNTSSFEEGVEKPEGCVKSKNITSKRVVVIELNRLKPLDINLFISKEIIDITKVIEDNKIEFIFEEKQIEILKGEVKENIELDTKTIDINDEDYIKSVFDRKVNNILSKLLPNINKLAIKKQIKTYIENKTKKDVRLVILNNIDKLIKLVELVIDLHSFNEDKFIEETFSVDNSSIWNIPFEIEYCDSFEGKEIDKPKNIHIPLYDGICNNLEKQYIDILEKDTNIKHWCKNGDNGSEYFYIPYFDEVEFSIRNFYPDFLIILNDGSFKIAETKGKHIGVGIGNKESIQKQKYLDLYSKKYDIEYEWYEEEVIK